jgi:hypothetical protein
VNNVLPVTDNAACDDPNEDVTVQQIPTDIKSKQSWYPNDTATVCSGTCSTLSGTLANATGGTLDFYLYASASCSAGTNNVNLKYSERVAVPASGGTDATKELSTKNYPGGNGTPVPTNATPAGTGGSFSAFPITTGYGDLADSTAGPYSWLIKYTPPDSAHSGSSSSCASAAHTEKFSTTYTNDPGH